MRVWRRWSWEVVALLTLIALTLITLREGG